MTEIGGRIVRVPTGLNLPAGQLAHERAFGVRLQLRMARAAVGQAPLGTRLVHAQDRRVLLASLLASRWLGVPLVVTLRDHGLLCPIAVCLHGQPSPGVVPPDCGQRRLWRTCVPDFAEKYQSEHGLLRRRVTSAYWYARLALDRRAAERADTVLFVSDALRVAHASAGFPRRAATGLLHSPVVVPPPTDPLVRQALRDRVGAADGVPVVLFVGKPSLGKGWPLFVRAAERALTEGRRAVFVHVGPEPRQRSHLVAEMGTVPHEGMAAWYVAADLVVVPPIQQDALPRVALEAAAAGCMVLGTRVGGIPEILDPLVLSSSEAFPGIVAGILRNMTRDMMRSVGQWQRAVVLEKFGQDRVAATDTEKFYREVSR